MFSHYEYIQIIVSIDTVGESKNDRFQEQSPLTLTKIIKNRKKHLEMYFHISKSLFGD